MADISAIADAIATRVKTISTLTNRCSAFGKDFVDPPWAVVVPAPGEFIEFDDTMDRLDSLTFVVKVLVLGGDDRASQDALTTYLDTSGSGSMKQAVDGKLGGLVADAKVSSARNYGEVQWAGMAYNGVEFVVEVFL